MENTAIETSVARPILIGLLLVMALLITACGGGSGGSGPAPPILPPSDYVMWDCGKVYRWNGLWWEWKCPEGGWGIRANQPVFTSLMDCQTAIGILQDTDPVILDNSQEDRDRGYAVDLFCIEV